MEDIASYYNSRKLYVCVPFEDLVCSSVPPCGASEVSIVASAAGRPSAVAGWLRPAVGRDYNATSWLHFASSNLQDSQPIWKTKMEPSVEKVTFMGGLPGGGLFAPPPYWALML